MRDLRVALVPVAGVNYDLELAARITRSFRSHLIMRGLRVAGNLPLVTDLESMRAAISQLNDEDYDLLLVFQAAFADSAMIVHLAETVDRPVFLWAVPEAPSGGRLRLNSLSGVSLAAHTLTLRNIDYGYVYADPDDAGALKELRSYASAARVFRRLKSARVGVIGDPPPGMEASVLDGPELNARLGIQIVRLNLGQVFERIQQVEAAATEQVRSRLLGRVAHLDEFDPAQVHRTLSAHLVLKGIAREEKLDALALPCWPEAFTELECSVSGAVSLLSDELIPCSSGADLNSAAAQLILQWLSEEPVLEASIVSADLKQDTLLLWHGGLAPLSMADRGFTPRASRESGHPLPLSLEFPLKPGRVTMARLNRAGGELRLVVSTGQISAAPPDYSGSSGLVRLDRSARQVVDTLLGQGLDYHTGLTYGECRDSLLALARLLHLPVLQL